MFLSSRSPSFSPAEEDAADAPEDAAADARSGPVTSDPGAPSVRPEEEKEEASRRRRTRSMQTDDVSLFFDDRNFHKLVFSLGSVAT